MKRDTVDSVNAVRVLSGYESPEGWIGNTHRAYWLDQDERLVKALCRGSRFGARNSEISPEYGSPAKSGY